MQIHKLIQFQAQKDYGNATGVSLAEKNILKYRTISQANSLRHTKIWLITNCLGLAHKPRKTDGPTNK